MEYWYPTGIRSFEIDRASKRGISTKERVNFFICEQPPHLSACIDQQLPGAALRRTLLRRRGLRQRIKRFREQLVEVVELTALEVALNAGFGFGSCNLKGYGCLPVKTVSDTTLPRDRGTVKRIVL